MEPEQLLQNYLRAICEWEAECARLDGERIAGRIDDAESWRIAMDVYRPIFEMYCSKVRATARETLAYSMPLDEPAAEKIVTSGKPAPDLVEIQTRQVAGHRKRHLYRLVLEEGQWRLFEKFIVAADGEMIPDEL